MSDQLPMTLELYQAAPHLVTALGQRLVLVESSLSADVVLSGASRESFVDADTAPHGLPIAADPTTSFQHETIKIMMAARAEQVEQLRGLVKRTGAVVPLMARPGSLWAIMTVGRAADNNLQLADPAVSGHHAQFELDQPERPCLLTDLGASNGTFLNGVRLQPHEPTEVKVGDCLRFGQKIFYVLSPELLRDVLARMAG